jgi:hypothetical protein
MASSNAKLTIADLWKLEDYVRERAAFRHKVLEHKKDRMLAVGPNMTLVFEDRLTMQYQVQEMLRIERSFEPAAIQEELDAYNPLIPSGREWIATCLIEFPDVEERKRRLAELRAVERTVWARVGDRPRFGARANEDLERSNEQKTSAVHFLRFELDAAAVAALRAGAAVRFGVDHASYRHEVVAPAPVRTSLMADLA